MGPKIRFFRDCVAFSANFTVGNCAAVEFFDIWKPVFSLERRQKPSQKPKFSRFVRLFSSLRSFRMPKAEIWDLSPSRVSPTAQGVRQLKKCWRSFWAPEAIFLNFDNSFHFKLTDRSIIKRNISVFQISLSACSACQFNFFGVFSVFGVPLGRPCLFCAPGVLRQFFWLSHESEN